MEENYNEFAGRVKRKAKGDGAEAVKVSDQDAQNTLAPTSGQDVPGAATEPVQVPTAGSENETTRNNVRADEQEQAAQTSKPDEAPPEEAWKLPDGRIAQTLIGKSVVRE